jgi:signal transduction histidine kinase
LSSELKQPVKTQNSKLKTQSSPNVAIRISDNGLGMSEDVHKKMFDPFFTTKPVGSGTGLGLSISHQIIVEKHRGQISCISALGQGTELIVEIPVQQEHLLEHRFSNPGKTSPPAPSLVGKGVGGLGS